MTESASVEEMLGNLSESGSRKSFLHLTEDGGDTSPLAESSYKLQLEHLEDRLRGYAALIKARDKELSSFYHDPSLSPLPTFEDETPRQTKVFTQLKAEVARLKSEIRTVNSAIVDFEQKLKETNTKLRDLEANQSSSFFLHDHDKMADLIKKISLFQHANGDLQDQVENAKSALKDVQQESEDIKSTLIPALQAQLTAYEHQRDGLKAVFDTVTKSLRAASRCSLSPGLGSPSVQLQAKTGKRAKFVPKSSPRVTPVLLRETQTLPTPRSKNEYVPSFLRSRKPLTVLRTRRVFK